MTRAVFIREESPPGSTLGRLAVLDDRIIIDVPAPGVNWYCDHCGNGSPVTAQFRMARSYITLCRTCLQNAINGIDYSRAAPLPPSPDAATLTD